MQKETDNYKVIKLLGEGSFGKAYLVENKEKQLFVVKKMDIRAMNEEEKKEAQKEAKILASFQHPNIIKFVDVYRTVKGKLCIVMDFAEGGDLSQMIKKQKSTLLSEKKLLDLFTQICLAVKHCHDKKTIHRDLKSQNIFLTSNNTIKLGDFGIAKVLNTLNEKAKTIVGTPYYLAPEIIEGKSYNFKSDIWALGVILYELCTLKYPFNAQSLSALALKIVRCQYEPLGYSYSMQLKSLLGSMLSFNPDKRPSITDILKSPIIQQRITNYLSESMMNQEFAQKELQNFKKQQKYIKLKNEDNKINTPIRPKQLSKSKQVQKSQAKSKQIKEQEQLLLKKQELLQLKRKKEQEIAQKQQQNKEEIQKKIDQKREERESIRQQMKQDIKNKLKNVAQKFNDDNFINNQDNNQNDKIQDIKQNNAINDKQQNNAINDKYNYFIPMDDKKIIKNKIDLDIPEIEDITKQLSLENQESIENQEQIIQQNLEYEEQSQMINELNQIVKYKNKKVGNNLDQVYQNMQNIQKNQMNRIILEQDDILEDDSQEYDLNQQIDINGKSQIINIDQQLYYDQDQLNNLKNQLKQELDEETFQIFYQHIKNNNYELIPQNLNKDKIISLIETLIVLEQQN